MLFVITIVSCFLRVSAMETDAKETNKPNILFIMADDQGWNDVDWHDPTLDTPNLNKLAHSDNTVQLENAYVNQCCSPTRSAFMSGYYPYHLGTQHGLFEVLDPSGVPLEHLFFPERLSSLGYNTYMVGKWHLGYCKHDFLPTKRGFEQFFGYYGGSENYYSHETSKYVNHTHMTGTDFFCDTEESFSNEWNKDQKYSTDVFTYETLSLLQKQEKTKPFFLYLAFQAVHSPLQSPPSASLDSKCSKITRRDRRIYCEMLYALDTAVGKVVEELKTLDLYNNTIIIFSSDNGGQTKSGGNNYPLRGNKDTLWEGGTRVNSFVHSPTHIKSHAVRTQLFHVVDWYATIWAMTGYNISGYGDGFNQWEMIKSNSTSNNRDGFVYNIDTDGAAIRDGYYKLIVGDPGSPSGWIPPTESFSHSPRSNRQKTWLFNIQADPNERRDLSTQQPSIVHRLMLKLRKLSITMVPVVHRALDARGNPQKFNDTYASGWC